MLKKGIKINGFNSARLLRGIYENDEVWDSDLLKIIRVLKEHEYDRTDLKGMIKKINKVARHLEIPTYITLEG